MTDVNVITREPSKQDYASPVQFRFKITKLPKTEYFVQTANLPSITLDEVSQSTRLQTIKMPGSTLSFGPLDLSFLVDENLDNYKELHDWMIGLGSPQSDEQFAALLRTGNDRFPGSTASSAVTGSNTPAPLNEGAIYSDATLTILNSKNIAKTEIRFKNVYPTSLGSLSYDVKQSDVDYLVAPISFNYTNYEIVQVSTT
tara:strand:+ start:174 stop:773 length:600 start_codon:yes stop_codon:yes gene_type:complete